MVKKPPVVAPRKPPAAVDPIEADRFVSAGTKTSERSDVQTSNRAKPASVRGKPKSLVERQDGRTLKRMTVYLPVDLAKRLAMHCVQNDRDVSETITEAVRRLMGRVS